MEPATRARWPGAAPVVAASGSLAIGMVPLFLVGALARPIGDDLGFGAAGTGAAIAVFSVAAGLAAVPVGWVTERWGAAAAIRAGVTISGLAALAVAAVVHTWAQLAAVLACAGVAIAFVDTGASGWFADTVPAHRRGTAFGVKEASVPAASLLAGLSIPLLADQLGWRSAFAVGALLAPLVWLVVPRRASRQSPPAAATGGAVRWAPLVVFAAGTALGTGAAQSAATFLVPALEDAGWSSVAAGVTLAAASTASITVRLVLGRLSDHRPGRTWDLVVAAMAVGAVGALGLASPADGAGALAAALVVLGAGWGWTGLAFHGALAATLDAPARGAGVVLSGLALGGAAGPAGFGALSSAASYAWAWVAAATALVLAAVLTATARRWQDRAGRERPDQRRVSPAPTR